MTGDENNSDGFARASRVSVLFLDKKNQKSRLDPLSRTPLYHAKNLKLASLKQQIFLYA